MKEGETSMAVNTASGAIIVGNWPLDEGKENVARDSTSNQNNGQLGSHNALPPTWTGGRNPRSTALQFRGKAFVKVATTEHLTALEPSKITAEAWVRGCNLGFDKYILSKGAESCFAASYGLYTGPSGGLFFYIYSTNDNKFHLSPD